MSIMEVRWRFLEWIYYVYMVTSLCVRCVVIENNQILDILSVALQKMLIFEFFKLTDEEYNIFKMLVASFCIDALLIWLFKILKFYDIEVKSIFASMDFNIWDVEWWEYAIWHMGRLTLSEIKY